MGYSTIFERNGIYPRRFRTRLAKKRQPRRNMNRANHRISLLSPNRGCKRPFLYLTIIGNTELIFTGRLRLLYIQMETPQKIRMNRQFMVRRPIFSIYRDLLSIV